jgi:Nucleotidyltransferase of unknown function (DUF6036)
MSDLTTTLDLLVALLTGMKVEYVIVGGLAVRAYSIPRATLDLDFTLALDRGQLSQLYDALEERDFAVPEPYRSGWVDQVKGLNLVKLKRYVGDRGIDVDLFLAESRFQEEMLQRRRMAEVEERALWIASPEDLVLLKLLAGRPRDLIDVNDVLFTQAPLDVEYMRRWAGELGVEGALERALAEQTND